MSFSSYASFAGPIAAGGLIGPLGHAAVLGTACAVVAVPALMVVLLPAPADEHRTGRQPQRGLGARASGSLDAPAPSAASRRSGGRRC
ncbi:hypothetical protein [Streptomyces sp. bgisy027]|uniref:hypothetical protein n=1 Tax=Streptomyces sp. bgisy027 TaxID=3413770 RepID=UPI003D7539F8